MSNGLISLEKSVSERLSKIFGKPVTVHLWIMSVNTPDAPDWQERDEKISLALVELFLSLCFRGDITKARFLLAEKNEDESTPHYAIDVQIGDTDLAEIAPTRLYAGTSSLVEGHTHLGGIETAVRFHGTMEEQGDFADILFSEYCKLLEQYYPQFKTTYTVKSSLISKSQSDFKRKQ